MDRDSVIERLADRGIASKVYFEPVHETTYYRETYERSVEHLFVTEISERVLSVPMHP